MQNINFDGLAQSGSYTLTFPIVDEAGAPISGVVAAKLSIGSLVLTIGAGLTFSAGSIIAQLNNERTASLIGSLPFELWIQIGIDKIPVAYGSIDFQPTTTRI